MMHKEQAVKDAIYQMSNDWWKKYNVMINEKQLFDQPVKNNILKYKKIKTLLMVMEMIIQLVVY